VGDWKLENVGEAARAVSIERGRLCMRGDVEKGELGAELMGNMFFMLSSLMLEGRARFMADLVGDVTGGAVLDEGSGS
jgi:hypothetical protein